MSPSILKKCSNKCCFRQFKIVEKFNLIKSGNVGQITNINVGQMLDLSLLLIIIYCIINFCRCWSEDLSLAFERSYKNQTILVGFCFNFTAILNYILQQQLIKNYYQTVLKWWFWVFLMTCFENALSLRTTRKMANKSNVIILHIILTLTNIL